MRILLHGGLIYRDGVIFKSDISIANGVVLSLQQADVCSDYDIKIDCSNKLIIPGFVDVHVHLREPGFSYKETILTGSMAAARSGYTTICSMPNLNPAPDSLENLKVQTDIIERDAKVKVLPYGCITQKQSGRGPLADLEALAPHVAAFTDDGHGVQDEANMRTAMQRAAALGRIIAAHCEDESLLFGGYIHAGEYAAAHGHAGISSQSEYAQLERDIALVRETGCRYHLLHASTQRSVEVIRAAKKEGLPVTCETGPHYLLLDDSCLEEDGRFKMNPPIRSKYDRQALLEALADGTVDVIATDHAPHSAEEKSRGLKGSVMGITGLETAFPVLYTHLVKTGRLPLTTLLERMCDAPRRIFGLEGGIKVGESADIAVLDLNCEYTIDSSAFLSMGHSTPFDGWKVYGDNTLTIVNGSIAYRKGEQNE